MTYSAYKNCKQSQFVIIDSLTPGVSLLLWTGRCHSCGVVLADRQLHTGPCGTGTGLQNSQSTYWSQTKYSQFEGWVHINDFILLLSIYTWHREH